MILHGHQYHILEQESQLPTFNVTMQGFAKIFKLILREAVMVRKKIQEDAESSDTNTANKNKDKSDVIEIPVGKYVRSIKSNPWMVSTFLLGLIVIVLVAVILKGGGETGNVISENDAAKNLLSFINAQGSGEVNLVSTEKEGTFYRV